MDETTTADGIFDKFHNLSDVLGLLHNGTIAAALALVRDVKNKDLASASQDVQKVLTLLGFKADADAVARIIADVQSKDWLALTTDGLAEVQHLLEEFGKKTPEPPLPGQGDLTGVAPRMGAGADPDAAAETLVVGGVPTSVKVMTREQSRQWYADNRAAIRRGSQSWLGKRILGRRVPEVQKLLAGEAAPTADGVPAFVAALDPARLAQIIEVLRKLSTVLAFAGAFYPPLTVIASVLKLIVAYYDANHPTIGASADGDHGLALGDLV